jgi:hypothetical protein
MPLKRPVMTAILAVHRSTLSHSIINREFRQETSLANPLGPISGSPYSCPIFG